MPAQLPASEFGGKVQRNTIMPPVAPKSSKSIPTGHLPTNAERLRLQYLTGQDADPTRAPDPNSESFMGLLRLGEQIAARRAEGVNI